MNELILILKKHCLVKQNTEKLYEDLNDFFLKNLHKNNILADKASQLASAVFEIKSFLIENEEE